MEKDRDIERLLKSVPPPPLPVGLRQRVLGGAAQRAANRAVLTPLLRVCFIVSAAILITALAADAMISRKEAVRTAALFPVSALPEASAEDPVLKAEIYAAFPNAERFLKKRVSRSHDGLNLRALRLSGRDMNIKEEFNGYEN